MTRPILLTGATGFIAKHIAADLLAAGHHVRASVRNDARAAELRAALAPVVDAQALTERLEVVTLDLTRDDGWRGAVEGVEAVIHTASPFPLKQPCNPEDLLRPAVDGTLRALRAAADAGVGRVVLTSSVAAILNAKLPPGQTVYDETIWSDPRHPAATPYDNSKTLAERAAWDFVAREAPEIALTVLNPGLVMGPPLDARIGSSLEVLQRLLGGKDPMLPGFGLPVVDVRDVATAHVRALDRPDSVGQRIPLGGQFLWLTEMAQVLAQAYPDRRIVTRRAPDLVVRGLALFDPAIRSILPKLGQRAEMSDAQARTLLGLEQRPAAQALRDGADALIRLGLA